MCPISLTQTTIDDLKVFVQIVDSGGFTAAARTLNRSTKQVSRQLQRLERGLEQALLHRTTHALSMTEAGRRFYHHALQILYRVEEAESSLQGDPHQIEGQLRIVVPGLDIGVMSWAAAIRTRHPRITLQLGISDHPIDLIAEGVDLQLSVLQPHQTSMVIRRIATLHSQLVAHHHYLSTRAPPQTPDDLFEHESLLWITDRVQTHWTLIHPKQGRVTVPVRGALHSSSSSILFSALQQGLGIGPCGKGFLKKEGITRGLVPILPEWSFEPLEFYAIYPPNNRNSALITLFLDYAIRGLADWY